MGTINKPMKQDGINKNPIAKFNSPNSDLKFIMTRQVNEIVSFFGHDVLYLKVDDDSYNDLDEIFGELKKHLYKEIFELRMYVEHGVEFGMNHQFSSMGLVFKDEISFFIAIDLLDSVLLRKPTIGDIIYYIPAKRYFKVNYVNYEAVFYAGHKAVQYQLKCTEYIKNEKTDFKTMDVEVNRISQLNDITSVKYENPISKNVIDTDEKDPFGYFN